MTWCVIAYREGWHGMEIYGPYNYRVEAAAAAVKIASREGYTAAYPLPLLEAL
jgi:hypothetical protein